MRVIPAHWASAHPDLQAGVVAEAFHYFAHHFGEEFSIEQLATAIGIPEACLEFCFDLYCGKTPYQSLQLYRLNRLFEAIATHPGDRLLEQVGRCGLPSVTTANHAFEQLFGIGLVAFRRSCRRAAQDRSASPFRSAATAAG